jgi:hypothetical protein
LVNWRRVYIRLCFDLQTKKLNFCNKFHSLQRYAESARSLEKETNLDLRKFDICDNIDLDTILQEYESYYYVRFSKYPKITKKVTNASKLK